MFYSINFVDENDIRSFFFSLFEEVVYMGCIYIDKYFNEIGIG